MLESLVKHKELVRAVRLVAPDKAYVAVLTEMGVDQDDLGESLTYFGDLDATSESGLDLIFKHRGQRGKPHSRFTDGSIPVYYTALDRATAEAEIAHWLVPIEDTPNYFRPLVVEFLGAYPDLGELASQPTFLTGEKVDGAYAECLAVTREAVELGYDAFKTHSARLTGGRCFPILSRDAIRSLTPSGYVRFDYDNELARWTCRGL